MRKETVDLLEMMDLPLTKDLKDLLDQMDKWDILETYIPEIPSIPEPTWWITTTDVTYITTDSPIVYFD